MKDVYHHRNVHNLFMWKSYVPNLCFYIVNNKAFHFIYRGRYVMQLFVRIAASFI